MVGVSAGVAATLGLLQPSPEVITQMAATMGLGTQIDFALITHSSSLFCFIIINASMVSHLTLLCFVTAGSEIRKKTHHLPIIHFHRKNSFQITLIKLYFDATAFMIFMVSFEGCF